MSTAMGGGACDTSYGDYNTFISTISTIGIFEMDRSDDDVASVTIEVRCADDVRLVGDIWRSKPKQPKAVVIINPATGVAARYYHRFAAFLAEEGFEVLTFDYRGIACSRPASLKGMTVRWSDWGAKDFAAAVDYASLIAEGRPILVVGHSIGGFLPGLAKNVGTCAAILTVGAQYAYWRDYATTDRYRLFAKWHVFMPLLTLSLGYFPGRALGWIEDLPKGVALEWACRRSQVEYSFPPEERREVLSRLSTFSGPILAISAADDPYATPAAIKRALSYYSNAQTVTRIVTPAELGCSTIGHFSLFHTKHREKFWRMAAEWLASCSPPRST